MCRWRTSLPQSHIPPRRQGTQDAVCRSTPAARPLFFRMQRGSGNEGPRRSFQSVDRVHHQTSLLHLFIFVASKSKHCLTLPQMTIVREQWSNTGLILNGARYSATRSAGLCDVDQYMKTVTAYPFHLSTCPNSIARRGAEPANQRTFSRPVFGAELTFKHPLNDRSQQHLTLSLQ